MAQIAPERLVEQLGRGEPVGAIVLRGSDSYLREMCRNKIIETYVPEGVRDWAVARLSARDTGWDEILQRAETVPMLALRQVIIVDAVESVEKLGDDSRKEIVTAVEKYLESPAPFTVLLLEAAELDGRQKFYKMLKEKALIVELTIGAESAVSLAAQMARDLGTEIDSNAAALLADILNSEPARMRIELDKLAAYTRGRGRITSEDVEALVISARKNTIWQLADMIATRKRDAALAFLDNLLREGEQPAGIVGALAWMYRKLIEARDLPAHANGFQAARPLGMRPEAAEAALRNARQIPKEELLRGLVSLAEADSELKSANPDPRALMEFLIARLTMRPAPA
jgi:DNA polymerase III subunit delta